MNTKGVKLLLFSVIVMLFSLMLAFAGFVYLLLNVTVAFISATTNQSYHVGRGVFYILVLAIVAGIGGLFVAWFGINRND